MGCVGWQVMPFPLVFLQGYANGHGCPQQGNLMETIPSGPLCLDPQLRQIDFCLSPAGNYSDETNSSGFFSPGF